MEMHHTDKAWEKWGATAPYYGVLTSDEYRGAHLNDRSKARFFETGRQHFDHVLDTIGKYVTPEFRPSRALDFGCGTGRVLIPIAHMCEEALGVDVSESMLLECAANCEASGLKNVALRQSGDLRSALTGQYDLIHSFIVFQHIRRSRGERLVQILLKHLSNKGVAVLQFVYQWDASLLQRLAYFLRHYAPLAHPVMNLLRHRYACEPKMEMNVYNMNRVLGIMNYNGVQNVHFEFVRHGAHHGVVLYIWRRPN
jgi:2-polyprenyl-3-methyl-5-hydroxy-6-metoxy-1,4-benzoquinol methylase